MKESISIQIKYLAALRDRIGHKSDTASFAKGTNLEAVSTWLNHRYALSLPDPQIMLTLNGKGWTQLPHKMSTQLAPGDVICLFPIISSG